MSRLTKLSSELLKRHRQLSVVLSKSLSAKTSDISYNLKNCVQRTKVQVCGDLWSDFKARGWKLYQDAPADGIVTEAEYFDNKSIVGCSAPTVLLLHGTPGGHEHFAPLIFCLTELGVRVVVPSQPTMTLTRKFKHFRHSPEERSDFVKAILREADISSLDMVAGHSTGTLTSLHLFKGTDFLTPKSLVLFNPLGFETLLTMRPEWLITQMIKTWQTTSGRFVLDKVGVPLLAKTGNPFLRNKWDDVLLAGFCCHHSDKTVLKSLCHDIARAGVPTLIMMADNDTVMNKRMNANYLAAFGSNASSATVYDKEGKVENLGERSKRISIIRMASGGHFAFLKFSSISNSAVIELLDKVTATRSQVTLASRAG